MKPIKIGFDLGNNSLKIAVNRRGSLEFHECPLPENLIEEDTVTMPHAFSSFLKKVKKNLRLPSGTAGLLLPSSQVICRLVTMPRMSIDQLMLNLPHEFSDFIHGEPHQYHCDYALCEEPPQEEEPEYAEMTMMAAVVEKQQVIAYGRMFAAGGFPLRLILPQEMALINLVKTYCQLHPDASKEFCFIDLGYLSTRIFIVHHDRIQATRRIPTGCRELDQVIADLLNVDRFLADSYKRGNHQNILEADRCIEIYEHIAVEVLKLVNFYHFTYRQNQLNGIYLIGGGAEIKPLCRILEEATSLPALSVQELLANTTGEAAWNACVCAAGLLTDTGKEG